MKLKFVLISLLFFLKLSAENFDSVEDKELEKLREQEEIRNNPSYLVNKIYSTGFDHGVKIKLYFKNLFSDHNKTDIEGVK